MSTLSSIILQDWPRTENEKKLALWIIALDSCDFLSMLRRILKIHAISLIFNASLRVFLLLTYFVVSTSPICLYLVERSNAKDLLLIKSFAVHNTKLTKDASLSHSSVTAHLNVDYPDMLLSANKDNKFVKLLTNSRRKLLSVQTPLPLISSNVEFPNATNSKRQRNKSLDREVSISSSSSNDFLNSGTANNITGHHISENDVHTVNVKTNVNDNSHLSVLESELSSLNSLNASNQSSLASSPLVENNSSMISVSSTTLDINSSNNSAIDTTVNESTSLPTSPCTETTEIDPPSTDSQGKGMTSGAIAGVVIAVLATGIILTGTVIYLLYQKCMKSNKLESKCPSDNCGYVDDTLRSSGYLNSHIELPKESSEEMTSLDNDSFLNSLESMTFQNYWADNTKNTKV